MSDSCEALGDGGAIAEEIPGFKSRPQQLELARAVESAIADQSVLIGEAGTGVGKTFAYLVPALLSGRKTIVSTGTRHLQDQLYHTDLPRVIKALKLSPKRALLKGRANYLCEERLQVAMRNPALADPSLQADFQKIAQWASLTRSGDISECTLVPEDAMAWAHCVSEEHHCAGHDADALETCYVAKARRKAQGADIVVVNHHLLCADLALKETGFGELLPEADTLIVDEAHQLPEVASVFFGDRISSRQLLELSRDVVGAQITEAPEELELRSLANVFDTKIKQFRLALGDEGRREAWAKVLETEEVSAAMVALSDHLVDVIERLQLNAARGKQLESVWQRAVATQEVLKRFADGEIDKRILWFETYKFGFALNSTPLDVSWPLQRAKANMSCAWVLVSATMAVNKSFDHFSRQLGFADAKTVLLDSPFDYKRNALMFAPGDMPEPNSPSYTRAVIDVAVPCLEASEGRCFLLFTSHRAMREAYELLKDRVDYPLYMQGDQSKHELLESFKNSGNGVLLGTSSFWEGVDVRGEALQLVIIDKLPFASPGDPVLEARISAIKERDGNPFFEFQLPQAIVALKQGVGRLIRDYDDQGVLVICDPRLTTRSYGRQVVESLPPMLRTRDPSVIQRFFNRKKVCAS